MLAASRGRASAASKAAELPVVTASKSLPREVKSLHFSGGLHGEQGGRSEGRDVRGGSCEVAGERSTGQPTARWSQSVALSGRAVLGVREEGTERENGGGSLAMGAAGGIKTSGGNGCSLSAVRTGGGVIEDYENSEVLLVDEVDPNDARNRSFEGSGRSAVTSNEEGEGVEREGTEGGGEGLGESTGSSLERSNDMQQRLPFRLVLALTLSSFFLQLGAVSQADYSTLRMAFIHNHRLSPTYDFHAFLLRSMRMDFLAIVGTAWYLWLYVISTVLFNIYGWNEQICLCFVPLFMALVIGTKLKYITAKLALDSQESSDREREGEGEGSDILMRPRNSLFWFHRPQFLLSLLHFMLFMNSFSLAQTAFDAAMFGMHKCPGGRYPLWQYIVQVAVSLLTQFWCSFVTLPLYALVTHMGSDPKAAVFGEDVLERLRGWRRRHRPGNKKGRVIPLKSIVAKSRTRDDGGTQPLDLK